MQSSFPATGMGIVAALLACACGPPLVEPSSVSILLGADAKNIPSLSLDFAAARDSCPKVNSVVANGQAMQLAQDPPEHNWLFGTGWDCGASFAQLALSALPVAVPPADAVVVADAAHIEVPAILATFAIVVTEPTARVARGATLHYRLDPAAPDASETSVDIRPTPSDISPDIAINDDGNGGFSFTVPPDTAPGTNEINIRFTLKRTPACTGIACTFTGLVFQQFNTTIE